MTYLLYLLLISFSGHFSGLLLHLFTKRTSGIGGRRNFSFHPALKRLQSTVPILCPCALFIHLWTANGSDVAAFLAAFWFHCQRNLAVTVVSSSVLAEGLAGNRVSETICFVSSETLNLDWVSTVLMILSHRRKLLVCWVDSLSFCCVTTGQLCHWKMCRSLVVIDAVFQVGLLESHRYWTLPMSVLICVCVSAVGAVLAPPLWRAGGGGQGYPKWVGHRKKKFSRLYVNICSFWCKPT